MGHVLARNGLCQQAPGLGSGVSRCVRVTDLGRNASAIRYVEAIGGGPGADFAQGRAGLGAAVGAAPRNAPAMSDPPGEAIAQLCRVIGVQIDLVIERNDGVINLCEMKYCRDEYEIDAAYERQLQRRCEVFRRETGTKSALHTTMVTTYGLVQNIHAAGVQAEVTMEDLF